MSLLGDLGNAVKGGIGGFITGGYVGAAAGAVAGAAKSHANTGRGKKQKGGKQAQNTMSLLPTTTQYSASPSLRLAPLPSAFVIGGLAGSGQYPASAPVTMGGGGATGSYAPSGKMRYSHNVVDGTTGRVYRVSNATGKIIKPRHMNPLNGRAAARAIRRIKGARKMLQAIERSLPKARTHHPRAR